MSEIFFLFFSLITWRIMRTFCVIYVIYSWGKERWGIVKVIPKVYYFFWFSKIFLNLVMLLSYFHHHTCQVHTKIWKQESFFWKTNFFFVFVWKMMLSRNFHWYPWACIWYKSRKVKIYIYPSHALTYKMIDFNFCIPHTYASFMYKNSNNSMNEALFFI